MNQSSQKCAYFSKCHLITCYIHLNIFGGSSVWPHHFSLRHIETKNGDIFTIRWTIVSNIQQFLLNFIDKKNSLKIIFLPFEATYGYSTNLSEDNQKWIQNRSNDRSRCKWDVEYVCVRVFYFYFLSLFVHVIWCVYDCSTGDSYDHDDGGSIEHISQNGKHLHLVGL